MEIFVNTKNNCSTFPDSSNSSHSCSITQVKTIPKPPTLHLLPCNVDFEGPAKVDTYFLIEQLVDHEVTLQHQYRVKEEEKNPKQNGNGTSNNGINDINMRVDIDHDNNVNTVPEKSNGAGKDASKKSDSNEKTKDPPSASLSSSFRGRKLIGREVILKDGYEGFIFKETSMKPTSSFKESSLLLTTISSVSNNNENENNNDDHLSDLDRELLELTACDEEIMTRCWETAHEKFDRFTVWGHDEFPESWNCQIIKSLEWLEISEAFHKPTPPPIAVSTKNETSINASSIMHILGLKLK
ncbi:3417_t:CDS:2, partial [Ambispora gerdemannii]